MFQTMKHILPIILFRVKIIPISFIKRNRETHEQQQQSERMKLYFPNI